MYCKNCGNKIRDDAVMCPYCKTFQKDPFETEEKKEDKQPQILLNDSGLQTQHAIGIVLLIIFGIVFGVPLLIGFIFFLLLIMF